MTVEMKEGKIIVTGGRTFKHRDFVFQALNTLQREGGPIRELVEGGATGVDAHARAWAKQNILNPQDEFQVSTWVTTCKAQWAIFGRAAEPLRNAAMCATHRDAAALVAFPGGRGTGDCVRAAHALGIPVIRVQVDGTYVVEAPPKRPTTTIPNGASNE
jgi:hypothetical protein